MSFLQLPCKSMEGIFSTFAFVLGCCVGSFMNVVTWRLPRGESLVYPPSHCPRCGHAIRAWENIPIISWLCLRARCSGCGLPISVRYPLGEAAVGMLYFLVWYAVYHRMLPWAFLPGAFFLTGALLAAAWIDAFHRFIPDLINYSGLVVALALAIFLPTGRLALQEPISPHSGAFILSGLRHLLAKFDIPLGGWAVIDAVFGAALGYAILTIAAWSLRRILGTRNGRCIPAVEARLSEQGLKVATPIHGLCENTLVSWEELLDDESDVLTLHGPLLSEGDNAKPAVAHVRAGLNDVSMDGERRTWACVKNVSMRVERWSLPGDAIGAGDAKFLAMTGAFLGADAVLYTLLWAAVLGTASALFSRCLTKLFSQRKSASSGWREWSLPFAPFMALAAFLWMTCGNLVFRLGAFWNEMGHDSPWQ
ncbi:MAG: prepilin peptidase [Victivallales bacterium]|nr:prepilin peptidase [Victivallales bacterium]